MLLWRHNEKKHCFRLIFVKQILFLKLLTVPVLHLTFRNQMCTHVHNWPKSWRKLFKYGPIHYVHIWIWRFPYLAGSIFKFELLLVDTAPPTQCPDDSHAIKITYAMLWCNSLLLLSIVKNDWLKLSRV